MSWFVNVDAQASGTGTTTRYWDCCKGSCAWPLKATLASGSNPVTSCDATDTAITDYNAVSGCDSGSTYMCSDQTPWAISETLSYGFAATSISGGTEASWCCACYALTFTSGAVKGKQLIVQATNTGGDLGSNQFDLAVRELFHSWHPITADKQPDPRWWLRDLQRLYRRMGHTLNRLGRAIRRYLKPHAM